MIGAAAAYMSGLFFASSFTGASGILVIAAAAAVLVLMCVRKVIVRSDIALFTVFFTAAFAVCTGYTAVRYSPAAALDGCSGSFTGRVDDVTGYDRGNAAYILSGHTDSGVRVKVSYFGTDLGAEYGDTITVGRCSFSLPVNDYLFSSADYYRSQGVFLSLDSAKDVSLKHEGGRWLKNKLVSYRTYIIEEFRSTLGDDCGGFLAGMTFGVKQGLDQNIKTALYRSGIGHILAVSGLHVSVIVSLLMLLLKRLRVGRFVSFGIMNVMLLLLIIMADAPVSAVRAAVMAEFLYSAPLFRRENDTLNSLAAAALLICIAQPYAVFSAGFLLSLSGTFGIGVFAPWITRNIDRSCFTGKASAAVISAVCTTLSVFPLSMYFFDETSIVSPIVNVIIVPLCTAAMVLGVLFILTGGVLHFLIIPAGTAVRTVIWLSDRIARIGVFHTGSGDIPAILMLTAGAAAVMVYLLTRSRRTVALASAVSVVLFAAFSLAETAVMRSCVRVAVLGRGSNAAVVVSSMGRIDLIDLSGHYRSPDYVRRYLSLNGADGVDCTVLTKDIQSQYPAYREALEYFPVSEWITDADEQITMDMGTYTINCFGGMVRVDTDTDAVTVLPADSEAPEEGIAVYYGNVRKSTHIRNNKQSIYLDECECAQSGMGNIEIIAYRGGGCRIRRL